MTIIMMAVVLTNHGYAMDNQQISGKDGNKEIIIENIFRQLNSESMEERYYALIKINMNIDKIQLTERLIQAILHLAKKEVETEESTTAGELGEEYNGELTEALGNTGDPRAIPYLFKLGSGTSLARSLAKIGEPAILPLIERLHDKIAGYRSSAAYALGELIKENKLSLEVRDTIKKELINELKRDRNRHPDRSIKWYGIRSLEKAQIREAIVRALRYIAEAGDEDVIPIIEEIAKNDPYYIKKKDRKTGKMRSIYPVRREAEKALKKIKQKGGRK